MSSKKTIGDIIAKDNANVKLSYRKKRVLDLLDKANTLPTSSGCYLMKNSTDQIIYVGKAKNLKSRVMSYFNNSQKSPKTLILVGHIRSFEFILTSSDPESFVLENNLIKEHRPKYNIRLKDDKSYPYAAVDLGAEFPRLDYVRRPKARSKLELFGPFPVGFNISEIIKVLTKIYQLRDCSDHEFNSRTEPCILFQMKQCTAPCVGHVNTEEYLGQIDQALSFFKGKILFNRSLKALEKQMLILAKKEEFERAAFYRDQIEVLRNFHEKSFKQNVELQNTKDIDVVAFFVGDEEVDISLYLVRHGNLLGHKNYHFLKADMLEETQEEVSRFLLQYYLDNKELIPREIVLGLDDQMTINLKNALESMHDEKLKVINSSKKYQGLLNSTLEHAKETQRVRIENQDSVFVGLNRLKDLLGLKERPKTLECYDIAIWQGKSPTASLIYYYEGRADKTRYRHYHLTELPEGNNDYAMMKEVFSRRLLKGDLPDVFVVDGGIGQVNTVKKVLDEFKIETPVVGIAKAKDIKKLGFRNSEMKSSEERLIIPGRSNPYILNKCTSLYRTIVQMRDEAHRFSRRLHHKTEKKRVITSWVNELKGVNQKTRDLILKNNSSSLEGLAKMNVNDIQNYLGIDLKYARIVRDYLHTLE